MSVAAEPDILDFRKSLERLRELQRETHDIERQIRAELENLIYRKVRMRPINWTRREVELYGAFMYVAAPQVREFGETGWRVGSRRSCDRPAEGLMVGFEMGEDNAHLVLALVSQRRERLFNLRYFTVELVEE